MGVGAWTFYNAARKHLADGVFDLDTATWRMSLYTSASNAATLTLSTVSAITNEVAENYGYSSSGKAITGVTWAAGASAKVFRFDSTAVKWSAAGGTIANVKYAVVWQGGASAGARKPICFSQLSTSQFSITAGNSLTVTPAATGYFELAGG